MPQYNYKCDKCNTILELRLSMKDYLLPESLPCTNCGNNSIKIFLLSPPFIGDPILQGVKKPPEAFLQGVLGRMENSVPDRSNITLDGKIKTKKVNFSKCRYSPGRMI